MQKPTNWITSHMFMFHCKIFKTRRQMVPSWEFNACKVTFMNFSVVFQIDGIHTRNEPGSIAAIWYLITPTGTFYTRM